MAVMEKVRSGSTLSKASPYEQKFGTRHRRVGRPSGDTEPLFKVDSSAVHPLLAAVAKRRAHAVVLEEQKERLADLFARELKVLRRRGVSQVAADCGVALPEDEISEG